MSFPASQDTLAGALSDASSVANRLKFLAQQLRDASAAGATGRAAYLNLQARLSEGITRWATLAAVPGLAAYAQAQYGNASLDIAAEFTAMRNAAITLRDWIHTNFPKDAGSGAALVYTYTQQGVPSELTFSIGQTAGFRTQADAFAATVG